MSSETFHVVTSDYVNVQITTSSEDICINEKKFQKGITIIDLKNKLELLTGGNASTMKIEVYNKQNELVCNLLNNEALLGSYPIDDGMRFHVVDHFNLLKGLDCGTVPKYEMPLDVYEKKSDTLRAYLMQNKLGKYQNVDDENKKTEDENEIEELAISISIGSRCRVSLSSTSLPRFGTVRFLGPVEGLPGPTWVGVEYDEPVGKNDGSLKGNRYFKCGLNYGAFLRPQNVECGDFPIEDDGLDEI